MNLSLPVTTLVDDCWNRIGVNGDRTCPELEAHVHCRNCPVFSRAARSFFDRKAPEGYLAEWSELLGRPSGNGAIDDSALLVFRLGAEWLALALFRSFPRSLPLDRSTGFPTGRIESSRDW